MDDGRRRSRQTGAGRDASRRRLRERFAPRWSAALRAGQVVSGRTAAPLADHAAAGAPTASRCGTTLPCSPTVTRPRTCPRAVRTEETPAAHAPHGGLRRRRAAGRVRSRSRSDCRTTCCIAGYEDPLNRLLIEARLPGGEPPAFDIDPTDAALASVDGAPRRDRRARRAGARRTGRLGDPAAPGPPCDAAPERTARLGDDALDAAPRPPRARSPATPRWARACRSKRSRGCRRRPPDPEPSPFDERPALARTTRPRRVETPQGRGSRAREGAAQRALRRGRATASSSCSSPRSRASSTPSISSVSSKHAAAALGRPIVLEGYLPPVDPRLVSLAVTPDPGVIEVNVHPAASWHGVGRDHHRRARRRPRRRASAPRRSISTARTPGTGGGNHLTLGGPTAGRQPAAAAPRSAAQHHHLLAAPSVAVVSLLGAVRRADEPGAARRRSAPRQPLRARDRVRRARTQDRGRRRHRAALARRPLVPVAARRRHRQHAPRRAVHRQVVQPGFGAGPARPPRAARLRDAAAPAHGTRAGAARARRSSPASPPSRTPVRSSAGAPSSTTVSCSRSTRRPTSPRSSNDLVAHGIAFDVAWLAPFFEFRFPRIGAVEVDGVTVELRGAIEPWSVLGEEVTSTGTSRYVDSSVERIQVKVDGFTFDRHLLTCNGVRIPLHTHRATGRLRRGRAVQGVATAVGTAPDDRRARAARVRRDRSVERPLARRMHVLRDPSRWPHLRPVPGQRQRGGGPPGQSILRRTGTRPGRSTCTRCSTSGPAFAGAGEREPGVPSHARSAARPVPSGILRTSAELTPQLHQATTMTISS